MVFILANTKIGHKRIVINAVQNKLKPNISDVNVLKMHSNKIKVYLLNLFVAVHLFHVSLLSLKFPTF